VSARGSLSLASRDTVALPGGVSQGLGVPRRKATVALRWTAASHSSFELRLRAVGAAHAGSGLSRGRVSGYTTLDATAALALPGRRGSDVTVSLQNALAARHREWPGAPLIGRLALVRLRHSL
jgi:hypothetical protein